MKKQLLLSLSLIISASSLFAQISINDNQKYDRKATENYTPNNNSKAGGGWFNYGREMIDGISSDATGYIGILHTDSSMVDGYIDDNGDTNYYNVYQHSRGQILDPTSFNFSNPINADFFNPGEGFTLDTIFFPYQYIRTQDQNPDKLIVQIYSTNNNAISEGQFGSGTSFYNMEYDYLTGEGANAHQTIEYDLTMDDTTGPGNNKYQEFTIDPPLDLPNGGLVAVTYTFVPGNTFNPGDTLASYDMPWVVNKRNSFIGYYVRDSEPVTETKINYNVSATSDIQYNSSALGWNGSYYPGNGYTSNSLPIMIHQNIWFHLTSTGTINNTNNTISLANINLYPNPANDKINIVLNNTNDVQNLTITDVTGRTIYSEKVVSNSIEVNTENYPTGIYFCKIIGAKTNETLKFIKTK